MNDRPVADGPADPMDTIAAQWRRERPDLDLSALGVLGRLSRAAALVSERVDAVLAEHGLRGGEFDVLAALRRAGEPYTLIPSELADTLMMTRAGMTGRIDRLERAGLVERRIDPADRRSFLVALTAEGLRAIDGVLADHADNLARITGVLDPETADGLDRALRLMLRGLEGSPGAG
ncbi:MarR family transcriptional regulator [Nocardiopsis sp. NPDC006139]|uniref:MarR family winged helix-turn-helix transcriptional regulator n=1 Tax=unclassified Nocardiopsis TaxID=2649073 RepID=UPI0033BAB771